MRENQIDREIDREDSELRSERIKKSAALSIVATFVSGRSEGMSRLAAIITNPYQKSPIKKNNVSREN